jgi:hypothetical protein
LYLRLSGRHFEDVTTVRSCANCVKDSGENLFEQLAFQKNNLIIFHSQVDKRNDGTDTVQLMIFIRGVDAAVHMCKYFAALCSMEDGAIGEDLFTQDRQRASNVKLRRVRETTVAVEKQQILHISLYVSARVRACLRARVCVGGWVPERVGV